MNSIYSFILVLFIISSDFSIVENTEGKSELNKETCESNSSLCRNSCIINGEGSCIKSDSNGLRFALIGDSGGLPIFPYITYGQKRVAEALTEQGRENPLDFVVNVGDNIYYNGVNDVYDSRFKNTFEDIYDVAELNVPWYTIAGNHDHYGNISAQHKYTKLSSKWTFPSAYYKISYEFGENSTTVDIIMIDTIVLCGNTREIENAGFFSAFFAKKIEDPDEPKDPKAAEAQLKWIEEQLNDSNADYLFVAGHYPIYSISDHGPMRCPIAKIDPLLKKYNVNAYFSGHDHTLQHISIPYDIEKDEETGVMNYVVSGAASRMDRSTKHINDIPPGSLNFNYPRNTFNPFSQLGFSNGAFVIVDIDSNTAKFSFLSGKNDKKYEFSMRTRTVH